MKRYGYLFDRVVSFENLLKASKESFKGKKHKQKVARFYFDMEKEILKLQKELQTKTYEPRPLNTFQIREPKVRKIGAPEFRDRVVHHAVCRVIQPLLERSYIHHSYACREGKGTHRAIEHAQVLSKRFDYFLKCDIRKYFESVDHRILKRLLERRFKDSELLWLLEKIIDAYGEQGKGIPIGCLTSQHFANFYLDSFDHLIKDELGVKGYLRYMDDFVLFRDGKEQLHELRSEFADFLREDLKLALKKKATVLAPCTEGLPFLGFRIYPGLIRIKYQNKKRLLRKLRSSVEEYREGTIPEEKYEQSLRSITEHLKIADTYQLRRNIFEEMFP